MADPSRDPGGPCLIVSQETRDNNIASLPGEVREGPEASKTPGKVVRVDDPIQTLLGRLEAKDQTRTEKVK